MYLKIAKAIHALNVGRQEIDAFLKTKGIEVSRNINARISDEIFKMLVHHFRPDLENDDFIDEILAPRPIHNSYILIDTNVFIDCPDIISYFSPNECIILSAKVVDELDYKKASLEDEKKKNAVQKALRNINNERDHIICYEFASTELLPPDFNKWNADNMILSIAIKYKNKGLDLSILTSDNGMQLKAKSLGIQIYPFKPWIE